MKRCPRCNIEKEESEFHNNKSASDGLNTYCKKCVNEARKLHRRKYPERCYKSVRNSILKNPYPYWVSQTISGHRREGYIVTITNSELKEILTNRVQDKCEMCGVELEWNTGNEYNPNRPTLDRINNEKDVSKENILVVCHRCNISKGNRTFKQFIEFCEMIVLKFKDNI